jgi:hypothetical protein
MDKPDRESSRYLFVADSVFQTLLTITTILSGSYSAIAFGWFTGAVGQATSPQVLSQATFGIVLGLIFIVPLILILLAWALSQFRYSLTWKTVAWSGLIYCLTQDFLGIIAMLGLALVVNDLIGDTAVVLGMPFIFVIPPALGSALGYRICRSYEGAGEVGRKRILSTTIVTTVFITIIQISIGLITLVFGIPNILKPYL